MINFDHDAGKWWKNDYEAGDTKLVGLVKESTQSSSFSSHISLLALPFKSFPTETGIIGFTMRGRRAE